MDYYSRRDHSNKYDVSPSRYGAAPSKYDDPQKYEASSSRKCDPLPRHYDSTSRYDASSRYDARSRYDASSKHDSNWKDDTRSRDDARSRYDSTPQRYHSTTNYGKGSRYDAAPRRNDSRSKYDASSRYASWKATRDNSPDEKVIQSQRTSADGEVTLNWHCDVDPDEKEFIQNSAAEQAKLRGYDIVALRSGIHATTRGKIPPGGNRSQRPVIKCDWHYTADFHRPRSNLWFPAHVYTETRCEGEDPETSKPKLVHEGLVTNKENPEFYNAVRHGHFKGDCLGTAIL